MASATAMNAAVIEAVRVPPSAFKHVGVDVDRAGPQRLAVDHGAEAAADQPLDLGRPSVGPAADPRSRAAGKHGVLGRQPAERFSFEKRRDRIGDLRSHEHRGCARSGRARCRGCCE